MMGSLRPGGPRKHRAKGTLLRARTRARVSGFLEPKKGVPAPNPNAVVKASGMWAMDFCR
jgi:hypothetical protein